MRKKRVRSSLDRKLRIAVDTMAEKLGISRAKFIEIAMKSELGKFNVHKENKRLTEAKHRLEHQVSELKDIADRLEREKTALTEQRDEFERLLHAETDVCNRYDARVKSLKKERDRFKAQAEEVQSNYDTCSEKLTLLLTRNWWERLWNVLPWTKDMTQLPTDTAQAEKQSWDTPSRPITPTPAGTPHDKR